MNAHTIENPLVFPEVVRGTLEDEEIDFPSGDFRGSGEETLGIFRGLLAAVILQGGLVLLVILGWQVWRSFR